MHSSLWTRAAALICLCAAAGRTDAQTITLPNGGLYPAGPDYATDVLQDAWDFSNPDDIAPDPDQMLNWTAPDPTTIRSVGTGPAFISGGWFRGVPATDSNITLLYRADAEALNPGRSGARFPIDTSRYRKLAVKMRVTGAPSAAVAVTYWFHASILEPNWMNRGGAGALAPAIPAGTSEQVYTLDLSQASPVYPPGAPYTAEAVVKGLRLDPLDPAAQGVEIDWVRLTTSNSHPNAAIMPVSVAGCSALQSLTISDASGTAAVIADVLGTGNTNRSFNYGILPPGAYTIHANCSNGTSAPVGFTINAPPVVTVVDPDETGDPATDYALLARNGDRWDFDQITDLARGFNVTTTGGACPSTGPCGIVPAEPPGTGTMLRVSSVGNVGDPGLELLNGVLVPLNSRRHSVLSFVLRNRRPYVLNAVLGPVLRLFWGSAAVADAFTVTTSQDMRVWPGLRRYTIDLATLRTDNGGIETGCPGMQCLMVPWTQRALRYFRLDPHEYTDQPTTFDIDDVTLTAPDEVALGQQFLVHYSFTDPDGAGAAYGARIYREEWATRTGRTLVATIPSVSPGAPLTYALNPQSSGIPPGRFLISVEIDEVRGGFTDTSRAEASGPLVVFDTAASSPRITVSAPTPNQSVPTPFSIQGCAYDDGTDTGGINVDDVSVRMRAIAGPRAGTELVVGFDSAYPGTGSLQFGPLGTPVACPTANGVYAQSGFRVVNIGAGTGDFFYGTWMIDVFARSSISGELVQLPEIPVQIGPVAPPGPTNFEASAIGNTVTVSWAAPGPGVAYYQIQVATNPTFSPITFHVDVPGTGPYSGDLASGTYYLRVYARSTSGVWSAPSATRVVNVALPQPPGPPVLVATQTASNPVTLNWSAGPGGSPTSFAVVAGTSSGASDLAVVPMGLATGISAVAPVGIPIYVRVVAANAAGQAASNEVMFVLSPPAAPTLSPASVAPSRDVTLRWTSVPNATLYTVLARYPGSPLVIASQPVAATTVTVPAPPGTYLVTVLATNAQGASAESNQITVVVP